MPAGLVKRRGSELLACVAAADIPRPAPPLPGRSRPDPLKTALLKNLVAVTQTCRGRAAVWRRRYWRRAAIWNCWPTVSATRRCCTAGAARCWGSACWRRSEARASAAAAPGGAAALRGRRALGTCVTALAFGAARLRPAALRTLLRALLGVAADAAGGLAHRRAWRARAWGAARCAGPARRARAPGAWSRHPDRPRHRSTRSSPRAR